MLQVEIGALERRPEEISGTVAGNDPLFADIGCELDAPVSVSGRVATAGMGRYTWRGRISAKVGASCRRCLKPVSLDVGPQVDVMFTRDQDAGGSAEYVITESARVLDLSEAVREELILAIPEYVLCREECRGICPSCGTSLNVESCDCRLRTDPRWEGLEVLKTKLDG